VAADCRGCGKPWQADGAGKGGEAGWGGENEWSQGVQATTVCGGALDCWCGLLARKDRWLALCGVQRKQACTGGGARCRWRKNPEKVQLQLHLGRNAVQIHI